MSTSLDPIIMLWDLVAILNMKQTYIQWETQSNNSERDWGGG